MIAIGERINGMFSDVKKAIVEKDEGIIIDLAQKQTEAGAKYLDVNVGPASADPLGAMQWLVKTIQKECQTPLTLDSQKLDVIKAGLEVVEGEVMINSVSADAEKLDVYMPIAVEKNAALITLTMSEAGVPQDVDTRVMLAAEILGKAMEHGMDLDKIYIDPIVLPVNCDQKQPQFLMEVFSQIQIMSDPPPHTVVGLSNVSQGATERSQIDRAFVTMAIASGLDSAIMNVLDTELMDAAITAELLMNKFIYSDSYLQAARK